jgi:type I restriction enzyme S subunit
MGKWEMVRLGEVLEDTITGEWGTDCSTDETGVKVLRTTNFTNTGVVDYSNVVFRNIPVQKIARKQLKYADIILEKSGGSDNQPVGRVVYFENIKDTFLCNNFTQILRVNANIAYAKYVFYYLFYIHKNGTTELLQNKTTGIRNLQTKSYFIQQIPLPPLDVQQKIADILDKASSLIELRKAQLEKLDLLIKSQFIEMFGETVLNPKEFKSIQIADIAKIVSGITKGRKTKETSLREVPYMSVSNVKDGYIDWTTVKTIAATQSEIDQYRLLPDDILMTEGGDPDKVGRGAIISKPLQDCIHQNHIFRVRLDESAILPLYFAEYLKHPRAKRYFLGCAKQTTGIASINMKQLKSMPVLLPPISLQNEFAAFVEQVEQQKKLLQQSLTQLELNYKSLMQKCFRGELF